MDNHDYYAFVESILDDPQATLEEKIEAEVILNEYYTCLAELVNKLEDDDLSEDELDSAYAEWCELTGSEPVMA